MANPIRRGESGSQVSSWNPSSNTVTPNQQTSFILPYGLTLQQKVGQAVITNVVDAGATVVYTADNNYSAGDIVSIYDVNPVAYNLRNATILSATSTTFTITTAATGTYVSGGVAQKTGTIAVTIPTGITWVYAICVGNGGGGAGSGGGGAGGVAWGWTLANSTCVIAAPGATSGITRYGHIIAGTGGQNGSANPFLGGGARSDTSVSGSINYFGMPAGTVTSGMGSGAAGGNNGAGRGGDGISGGGGSNNASGTGFRGGNGLVGAGGGSGATNFGGGDGGAGINILTGANTSGAGAIAAAGVAGAGGGGGGLAGNGTAASGTSGGNGGLGGGGGGGGNPTTGAGGAGILYIFY